MAKAMDIEKATKDGTIGLLVSHVYKNSPAEKIGIKPQDVLLSIKKKDDQNPIELAPSDHRFDFDWDFGEFGPEREYDVRFQRMKKPWKRRRNFLTMMLQAVGVGKKLTLSYLHEGKKKDADFQVAMAPRDFDSAEKHKDEDLGITVKQLTYEVRKALNLDDKAPGVVVAKVEPGGPAGVAKLALYELLTKIEGKDVTSVDNFKERIKKAQDAGKKSVVVTVFSMGKSRIADLDVQAKKD
jgi:S1-C subfamily serine protease